MTNSQEFEHESDVLRAIRKLKGLEESDSASNEKSDEVLPSTIGEFQIKSELGRGGMGVVYKAYDQQLDRQFALKVISSRRLQPSQILTRKNEDEVERFRKEATSIAKLQHSNIVQVYRFEENLPVNYDPQPGGGKNPAAEVRDCIAMQLVKGAPLNNVIESMKTENGRGGSTEAPKNAVTKNDNTTRSIARLLVSGVFGKALPTDPELDVTLLLPNQSISAAGTTRLDIGLDTDPPRLEGKTENTVVDTTVEPLSDIPTRSVSEGQDSNTPHSLIAPQRANEENSTTSSAQRNNLTKSVTNIGIQIANALAYAHRNKVVHRDIKPANIVLECDNNNEQAWLLDFGLAEHFDPEVGFQSEGLAGSLRYMAPEVFEGQAGVRSDLYSFGATLFELLTFQPLIPTISCDKSKKFEQYKTAIQSGQQQKLTGSAHSVPRDLAAIIDKCTSVDPNDRYENCQQLEQDLRWHQDRREVTARPRGWAERLFRACEKHKVASTLAGVLLVLASFFAINRSIAAERESGLKTVAQTNAKQARKSEDEAVAQKQIAVSEKNQAFENFNLAQSRQTQLAQRLASQNIDEGNLADAYNDLLDVPLEKRSMDTHLLEDMARVPATELFSLTSCSAQILDSDLSSDGKQMVAIDAAGNLVIWDLETLEQKHLIKTAKFNEQNRRYLHVLETRYLLAKQKKPQPAVNSVTAVCFGQSDSIVFTAALDGSITKYELNKDLEPSFEQVAQVECDDDQLYVLERQPDTNRLYSAGKNGTVYQIEMKDGALIAEQIGDEETPILALTTTTDGLLLGTSAGRLVYQEPSNKTRFEQELGREIYSIVSRSNEGSPTDVFVASRQPLIGRYTLDRTTGLSMTSTINPGEKDPARYISSLVVDGDQLFALVNNGEMAVVTLRENSLNPDVLRFQCSKESGLQSLIVSLNKDNELPIEPPFFRAGKLIKSSASPVIFTTTQDSFVRGWSVNDDPTQASFLTPETRFDGSCQIEFQPNATHLVWGLSSAGNLQLVDTTTDKKTATRNAHDVGTGIKPLTNSDAVVTWGDRAIKFWKLDSSNIVPYREKDWIKTDAAILGVAVHPLETQLAAVDEKGYLLVWDLKTMQLLTKQLITTHEARPNSGAIDYNLDGSLLACLGPVSTAPIYETKAFRPIPDHLQIVSDSGKAICWSPSNSHCIIFSDNSRLVSNVISGEGGIRRNFRSANRSGWQLPGAMITTTGDRRRFVTLTTDNYLAFLDPETSDFQFKTHLGEVDYISIASASGSNCVAVVSNEGQLLIVRPELSSAVGSKTDKDINSAWLKATVKLDHDPDFGAIALRQPSIDQRGRLHGSFVEKRPGEHFGPLYYYCESGGDTTAERLRPGDSKYNAEIGTESSLQLAGENELPTVLFRRRNPIHSPFAYEKFIGQRVDNQWQFEQLEKQAANDFMSPLGLFSENGTLKNILHGATSGYYFKNTSKMDGRWQSEWIGVQGDGHSIQRSVQPQLGKSIFGYQRYRFTGDANQCHVGIWENDSFRSVIDPKILSITTGHDGNLYGLGRQHSLDGKAKDFIYVFNDESEQWVEKWPTGHRLEQVGWVNGFGRAPRRTVNKQGEIIFAEASPDHHSIVFRHHQGELVKRYRLNFDEYMYSYNFVCDDRGNPVVVALMENTGGKTEVVVFRMKP